MSLSFSSGLNVANICNTVKTSRVTAAISSWTVGGVSEGKDLDRIKAIRGVYCSPFTAPEATSTNFLTNSFTFSSGCNPMKVSKTFPWWIAKTWRGKHSRLIRLLFFCFASFIVPLEAISLVTPARFRGFRPCLILPSLLCHCETIYFIINSNTSSLYIIIYSPSQFLPASVLVSRKVLQQKITRFWLISYSTHSKIVKRTTPTRPTIQNNRHRRFYHLRVEILLCHVENNVTHHPRRRSWFARLDCGRFVVVLCGYYQLWLLRRLTLLLLRRRSTPLTLHACVACLVSFFLLLWSVFIKALTKFPDPPLLPTNLLLCLTALRWIALMGTRFRYDCNIAVLE